MAVPKRKMSRANTRHRRSQWKAQPAQLVPIVVDGRRIQVPRHLVRAYQSGLISPDDGAAGEQPVVPSRSPALR